MKIGIVGPCGAGKTTLIKALKQMGYNSRHIAQEHSYVPAMWQIISKPDVLIFLDVSFEKSTQRRKLTWVYEEYAQQLRRLQHARQHANLIIDTDLFTVDEVIQKVMEFILKFVKKRNCSA